MELITRGAVYIALGTAILFFAYIFEMLDMALAMAVAVFVYAAILEHGSIFALTVYLGISILSFVLMPLNSGAVLFALALGWFPIVSVFTLRKCKRRALSQMIDCLLFTGAFMAIAFLFRKMFVADAELITDIERFCELFSLDATPLVEKLSSSLFLGLNVGQGLTILLYGIFALPFSLLFLIFLEKFTLFYLYKIRPILEKARIVKKSGSKR